MASSFPPTPPHTRCSRRTKLPSVPVYSLGLSASMCPTQCFCWLLQRPPPHPSSLLVNSVPSLLKCHPLRTFPGQTSSHSLSFLNSAALNGHPSSGPLSLSHREPVLFIKQELSIAQALCSAAFPPAPELWAFLHTGDASYPLGRCWHKKPLELACVSHQQHQKKSCYFRDIACLFY